MTRPPTYFLSALNCLPTIDSRSTLGRRLSFFFFVRFSLPSCPFRKQKVMTYSHYIFGYGSLICPSSRAVTAPTLQNRMVTPVRVHHLERVWSFPVEMCKTTFMGIRIKKNAECVGVLVPVNDDELAQFDIRELGYDRIPLDHAHIQKVPFLEENQHYRNGDNDSSSSQEHLSYFDHYDSALQSSGPPQVWVYLQQAPSPINPLCPLSQTYMDIIMRGCLSISQEFCKEFLRTTRGWSAEDFYDKEDNHQNICDESSIQKKEKGVFWVDDRDDPLYVRADTEYSKRHGHELDRLLKAHRPELVHRKTL